MLKIYLCGPTVYNSPHIGNLRPIITFDLMLKSKRFLGEKFKFIHNITDIDDKIINKASQQKITEKEVSEFYKKEYLDLLNSLDVDTISNIEEVSENMGLIIDYINKLVETKNAYLDNEGNVWFDVLKNKENYGMVSHQNLENMEFDDNYDLNDNKKYKADFALWKKTTIGIKFESKFGLGRPGWHTECCALIYKHFGIDGVDFHGGGMDLTFPHHENENIQHFALFKKPLAKEWLRTGQIDLEGIKMSKSLGNVILAKDFIEKYGPTLIKLIFLNSKLTATINITDELLENMTKIENKLQKIIFKIYTSFNKNEFNELTKSNEVVEALKSVSCGNFSNYNFLLNNELKMFNKDKNIINAKNIISVLKVIHPELTNLNRYKEAMDKFAQWNLFIAKKDYKNADILREWLIKNNFY